MTQVGLDCGYGPVAVVKDGPRSCARPAAHDRSDLIRHHDSLRSVPGRCTSLSITRGTDTNAGGDEGPGDVDDTVQGQERTAETWTSTVTGRPSTPRRVADWTVASTGAPRRHA